jgi:hypothetical protein
MSTKCDRIITMSATPENNAPKPLGTQLAEIADIYEDARELSTEGIQPDDYSEYADKLESLHGDENRAARLAFLGEISASGALGPDEYDKALDKFDTRAQKLFGWVNGFRLGTVEDGVLTLSTLEDEETHGSFMNDMELVAGANQDGDLYIAKFKIEHATRTGPFDPDEGEIETVRDAIDKLREVTTVLSTEPA